MNASDILVGGVVPALFLGLGTVLMRSSIAAGASIPTYLAVIGTTIALVGWTSLVLTGQAGGLRTTAAVGWAIAMALTWSAAIACISYGFGTLKLPVAVIAPLTNSNALVAVTIGALAFGEWRSLHLPMTLGGTLLICAGATLVSLSK
jgi:transporter family protein